MRLFAVTRHMRKTLCTKVTTRSKDARNHRPSSLDRKLFTSFSSVENIYIPIPLTITQEYGKSNATFTLIHVSFLLFDYKCIYFIFCNIFLLEKCRVVTCYMFFRIFIIIYFNLK